MKALMMVAALVLGMHASSPAQVDAATPALPGTLAPASLSTLSGPLVSSLAVRMVGEMVQGMTAAIEQAPSKPTVDVEVKVDKVERRWAVSPVWLAIGGLAFLVLITLIVMLSRGTGGTTVVRG